MMYLNLVVRKNTTEVIHNIFPNQNHGNGQVLLSRPTLTEALEECELLADNDTVIGEIKIVD